LLSQPPAKSYASPKTAGDPDRKASLRTLLLRLLNGLPSLQESLADNEIAELEKAGG
jgi:hypothetical protein